MNQQKIQEIAKLLSSHEMQTIKDALTVAIVDLQNRLCAIQDSPTCTDQLLRNLWCESMSRCESVREEMQHAIIFKRESEMPT